MPGPSGPCRSPPGPPAPCGCRRGRSRSCPRPSARPSTTSSRHAGASRVALFAEEDDGTVVLTVRDDGRGFTYDERRLLAEGKIGLAKSVKGRVEQLGGSMLVTSRPGTGTEIELRVPRSSGGARLEPPGPPRE
ncbi:MAG TPA: ATP-binding protein [Actinomycetota bacterium]|nr:ATP-binding protein [Actinomycetota bacterium]